MERYYIDFSLTFDYARTHPDEAKLYFVCDNDSLYSMSVRKFKTLKEAEAYCQLLNQKKDDR